MNNTKSYTIRPAARCAAWAAGIAVAAIMAVFGGNAFAAAFTAGNLVVERVGDGSATLTTTGNVIVFDEYTTTGTLMQSIAIPDGTTTNGTVNPMIESGTGTPTGMITLSPDGQTICFPGYAIARPFTSSIVSATAATVPRAIGTLDYNGNYTRAATSTLAFSGSNIRGAVTDGEGNYWGSGTASTTTVNAGVYYFGSNSAAAEIISGNLRSANIFNGALWFGSSSATPGEAIFEFNGQPTSAATPTEPVVLASADDPNCFVVNPAGTILYEADDGNFGAADAGIFKWTYSAGTWTRQYNLLNTGTVGTNCMGLAVNWNTIGGPTLFATTGPNTSTNTLIMVQDTGSANVGCTTLARTGVKEFLRGVVFAPTNIAGTAAPTITGIFPAILTATAGTTVHFSVSAIGTPPLSNYWYNVVGGTSNLVSSPPTSTNTLTFASVTGASSGYYDVVISNASAQAATSAVVQLVVNDPVITTEPANAFGLVDGTVQFAVTAVGTGLTYNWYYSDTSGNLMGLVPSGMLAHGSMVSGISSSTLTITNLQAADFQLPTNFVVKVTGTYGTSNSTPATLESVGSPEVLAFWNFNGTAFANNMASPPPWFGVGTASAIGGPNLPGTSPFAGSVDSEDGAGPQFPLGDLNPPNTSWGTSDYPAATLSNKLNGVQFKVSTVGAKNITFSYDSRVSATASDYERVQYTTDGSTWIDYPTSSTFGGAGTTYIPYTNSFVGFSNVANNPNFGIRIMTEFQSTATYGNSANAGYLGTANTYGTTGTISYDIVTVYGTAITNAYSPPTITGIANTSTPDNVPLALNFTVGSSTTPVNLLTTSVASLTPNITAPLSISGTPPNLTLNVGTSQIAGNSSTGPILLTVTDTNGDSTVTWFNLTQTSVNMAPTNSLATLMTTNTLANKSLAIAFKVTDDRTPANGQNFSFTATSGNNTVVPVGNITLPPTGMTSNVSVTIAPAANQLGIAQLGITVNDNDLVDAKTTTASLAFMVRPNTNVMFIDYFNYDNGGSLDTVASSTWTHLSGVLGQMQVYAAPTGGYVVVDTANYTEALQAKLLGAPYATNTSAVLYSSFIVNMNPLSAPAGMPIVNGSYFMNYNDGTGVTGDYDCCVVAATNGAANGYYRLGIGNWPQDGTATGGAVMFPMDLSPQSNYVVVTSLVLTNGRSTIWVNPTSQSSASVTDTHTALSVAAVNYPVSDIQLRTSGADAGTVGVGNLKVGTTFDSVFPSLQIASASPNVVVNWSDPTLAIQSATNVNGPWTDVSLTPGLQPPYTNNTTTNDVFFRFGH